MFWYYQICTTILHLMSHCFLWNICSNIIAPIVETPPAVVFPVFNWKTNDFYLVRYFRKFDGNTCSNSGRFPSSDVTKLSLSTACDPMGCSFNIIKGTFCKWVVHGQFLFKTFFVSLKFGLVFKWSLLRKCRAVEHKIE